MKSPPKKREPGAGEQTGQISTDLIKQSNPNESASSLFTPTEGESTNKETSNGLISDLRKLLGDDAVLLPIPRGRKGPTGKKMEGWQHFTPERMAEPEYLAQLNHGGNIGVLLGRGLITIDWDQDAAR